MSTTIQILGIHVLELQKMLINLHAFFLVFLHSASQTRSKNFHHKFLGNSSRNAKNDYQRAWRVNRIRFGKKDVQKL